MSNLKAIILLIFLISSTSVFSAPPPLPGGVSLNDDSTQEAPKDKISAKKTEIIPVSPAEPKLPEIPNIPVQSESKKVAPVTPVVEVKEKPLEPVSVAPNNSQISSESAQKTSSDSKITVPVLPDKSVTPAVSKEVVASVKTEDVKKKQDVIDAPNKQNVTAPIKQIKNTQDVKIDSYVPTVGKAVKSMKHKIVHSQKPIDLSQKEFVDNETLVLFLNSDDVVCGNLTEVAKYDNMGYSEYLRLYELDRKYERDEDIMVQTDHFIEERMKINNDTLPYLSQRDLGAYVMDDVMRGDINNLRVLDDNYKILGLADKDGNTLLHLAVLKNDPSLARWLIARGLSPNAVNEDGITPIEIAEYEKYWDVFNVLEENGGN